MWFIIQRVLSVGWGVGSAGNAAATALTLGCPVHQRLSGLSQHILQIAVHRPGSRLNKTGRLLSQLLKTGFSSRLLGSVTVQPIPGQFVMPQREGSLRTSRIVLPKQRWVQ